MSEDAAELRDVDPAELYYWLFDHVGAMSVVTYAELSRRVTVAEVERSLEAVQRRHPMLRLGLQAVDGELRLMPAAGSIPVEHRTALRAQWQAAIEVELDGPLDVADGPPARCLLITAPDREQSMLILVTHHAMSDGRSALSLMQDVVRVIDGGVSVLSRPYDVPIGLHDRFSPELRSARATVATVRAIQAERQGLTAPSGYDFAVDMARVSSLTRLTLGAEQVATLRQRAKGDGASLYGFLAAAVLRSAAGLLTDSSAPVLCLAAPIDLRSRGAVPAVADELVLAIGLLSTPYLVDLDGDSDLAARITTQVQREVDRGDSHLFYRLARAGSFAADAEGVAAFAAWLKTTPHNVAVSNVGVIDHSGDPDWLTGLAVLLAPGPTQLGFVVLSTYRGQMTMHVTLDDAKLATASSERFVAGIIERTGATQ